jgi:5'-3' exonuclease
MWARSSCRCSPFDPKDLRGQDGTDYSEGVRSIGPVKAVALVKRHGAATPHSMRSASRCRPHLSAKRGDDLLTAMRSVVTRLH